MKIKTIVAAFLLSLCISAAAQFQTVAEAYEVALNDIRLPQNEVGTIAFKQCGECSYETRRVNRDTIWEFNGDRMSLEKFRRNFASIDRSQNIPVQILYHLELNQVTRVWVATL